MKKILSLLILLTATLGVRAKDIQTVVFKVEQMTCVNCEGKVKRNIPYEPGVKKMKTDLENRTVTVTFDADKTSVEKIRAGFDKFGYKAEILKTAKADGKKKASKTPKTDAHTGATTK